MKSRISFLVVIAISFLGYIVIGYFTPRVDFIQLSTLFSVLFIIYFFILKYWKDGNYLRILIGSAILFRLSLLFIIPNLSDDYFRFIWDGRILSHGINPYLIMPQTYLNSDSISNTGITQELFNGLNSPGYYTIYPPVCQAIFAFGAKLFPNSMLGNIVVMRAFIILAEIGSILLITKLLLLFRLPQKNVLLYALNPLVIIELTGNLHFEALVIFFFLLAFYFLIQYKYKLSAFFFAISIGVKLIPFIFLPLIIKYLGWKKGLIYSIITITVVGILFIPFINSQLLNNLLSSFNLYFQKFEFNASIYYLVRSVGYFFNGYNIISIAGIGLGISSLVVLLLIAYFRKIQSLEDLFTGMLLTLSIYYFFSIIVHPWYICFVLLLSIFTRFRYPVIWSVFIPFTYITYTMIPYKENAFVILMEYGIVFGFFLIENRLIPYPERMKYLILKYNRN